MNKSLIGFCSFFLLTLVLMGFASSWLFGLLRLAVAIVAIILLLRIVSKGFGLANKFIECIRHHIYDKHNFDWGRFYIASSLIEQWHYDLRRHP